VLYYCNIKSVFEEKWQSRNKEKKTIVIYCHNRPVGALLRSLNLYLKKKKKKKKKKLMPKSGMDGVEGNGGMLFVEQVKMPIVCCFFD
jgi:hypothetical protein